jgi:MFS family permease
LLCLAIGTFDGTALSTALPKISADFGDLSHLYWVSLAYGLTAVVGGPMYGKLRDRWGAKRMIYVAIGIFLFGSLLSGLATSMSQLIAFRALQGIGGGGLGVLAHIAIGEISPPAKRARDQGLVGANFAISSASGPFIGGLITDSLDWRWVFYCSIPVALVGLAFVILGLKTAPSRSRKPIDFVSFFTFAVMAAGALVLLAQAGGAQDASPTNRLILAAVTVIAAAGFVIAERRSAEPLFPPRLLRNRDFMFPCLANGALFAAFQVQMLYMPLYFQAVLGLKAAESGLMMVGNSAGLFISSLTIVHWKIWFGRQKAAALIGTSIAGLAFAVTMIATFTGAPHAVFVIAFLTVGLAGGLAIPNIMAAVQNSVAKDDLGAATAAAGFSRSVLPLIGIAGAGAILNTVMVADLPAGFALSPELESQLLHHQDAAAAMPHLVDLLAAYHIGLDAVTIVALALAAATIALAAGMQRDKAKALTNVAVAAE